MTVRTQNHPSAARELFARVAVDDAEVCRHIDAAVFLRGGETEDMVVLIDRAADGAEAVVAVGHRIRHGEFGVITSYSIHYTKLYDWHEKGNIYHQSVPTNKVIYLPENACFVNKNVFITYL